MPVTAPMAPHLCPAGKGRTKIKAQTMISNINHGVCSSSSPGDKQLLLTPTAQIPGSFPNPCVQSICSYLLPGPQSVLSLL